MKKEYINPEIEVVRLTMNQHLLDGSPLDQTEDEAPVSGESYDALSSGFFDNGGSEDW